jgi:hypothetical protein
VNPGEVPQHGTLGLASAGFQSALGRTMDPFRIRQPARFRRDLGTREYGQDGVCNRQGTHEAPLKGSRAGVFQSTEAEQ